MVFQPAAIFLVYSQYDEDMTNFSHQIKYNSFDSNCKDIINLLLFSTNNIIDNIFGGRLRETWIIAVVLLNNMKWDKIKHVSHEKLLKL